MKKILVYLFGWVWGKKFLQPLFFGLYRFSLRGMNIGGGSDYAKSGEAWVLSYLLSGVKDFHLVDAGANKGFYARLAWDTARQNQTAAEIFCFEPSAATFSELQKNVEGKKGIQVFNTALGSQPGRRDFFSDAPGSGLASLFERDIPEAGIKMSRSEQVEVQTLDAFCLQQKISHIDLLKIDVEGGELDVLKGASRLLAEGRIRAIQFEFGGTAIDARVYLKDFFRLLAPHYNLFRVLSSGLCPLPKYSEYFEIFATTNFLAIKK